MARLTMTDFDRMIRIFSHHCGCIMTDEAPTKFKCGVGFQTADGFDRVIVAEIEITRSLWANEPSPSVWDQVKVNGKHCGNRCGGREEYAKLMAPILAEAAVATTAKKEAA